jgi:hypothetical protein
MPWPWSISSRATEEFINTGTADPMAGSWRDNKLSELGIVNVTVREPSQCFGNKSSFLSNINIEENLGSLDSSSRQRNLFMAGR